MATTTCYILDFIWNICKAFSDQTTSTATQETKQASKQQQQINIIIPIKIVSGLRFRWGSSHLFPIERIRVIRASLGVYDNETDKK